MATTRSATSRNAPEPPRDQDGRHPTLRVEGAHAVHERGDGLAFARNHGPHPLVPHHEVGGARVLVEQEHRRLCLDGLHSGGRLGRGAGGVGRAEVAGVRAGGQVVDERRDVRVAHGPAVLRAHGHGARQGDHAFAAVARHVAVDPALKGLQQCGLAVVAAAHDHRDALRHAHAAHGGAVLELQLHPQPRRGLERHRPAGERLVPVTGGAGQHGAVGHERHEAALGQLRAQVLGIQVGGHVRLERGGFQVLPAQRALDDARQHLREQPVRGVALDAPPCGGQRDLAAHLDGPRLSGRRRRTAGCAPPVHRPGVSRPAHPGLACRGGIHRAPWIRHDHGGALEDLLARALDRDATGVLAAARAQVPGGPGELPGEEVPGGHAGVPGGDQLAGDPGVEQGEPDPGQGRRGVRVRLHPVHDQLRITQPPRALELLVGAVAAAVQAAEGLGEVRAQ